MLGRLDGTNYVLKHDLAAFEIVVENVHLTANSVVGQLQKGTTSVKSHL